MSLRPSSSCTRTTRSDLDSLLSSRMSACLVSVVSRRERSGRMPPDNRWMWDRRDPTEEEERREGEVAGLVSTSNI